VRHLTEQFLRPYGIESSFCAADASDIESRLRPATRLIYLECPGSLVYEMCDLPRVAALARQRGILVAADNTWGSGLLYRPLTLGADISIIAATKYLGGHSDVMLGTATTTQDAWLPLQKRCDAFGVSVSPDDAWLVLRGVRTLKARLALHEAQALRVAHWLQGRPAVKTVFCPALADHPGHALWRRDFSGTNGLLSFELQEGHQQADADRFVEALRLFAIGSSWGGYESLVMPQNVAKARTVADWSGRGPVIRIHVGLEDVEDLLHDLEGGFAALSSR
jgi:cystathionine beta-lyase